MSVIKICFKYRLFLLSLAFACGGLLTHLGSLPGLHGDEAWVGLRARDILLGQRPLSGMNDYTGPLHIYFVALAFHVFGFKIESLRLVGCLFAIGSLVLYFRLLKAYFDVHAANLSCLFLVALPFFITFHRIANEIFILPFLALAALNLLVGSERSFCFRTFFCGVFLGLGLWTHLIFFSVIFATFITSFSLYRWSLFKDRRFFACTAGWLIGFIPRWLVWSTGHSTLAGPTSLAFQYFGLRLREWPMLFLQIAHGDEIFQRFTGAVDDSTFNLTSCIFLVGLFFAFKSKLERQFLIFSTTLFFSTLAIASGNTERYFLFSLYTVPVFMAIATLHCLRKKYLAFCFIAFFMVIQTARIVSNYFVSFSKTRGRISVFPLGSQLETSNHYVDSSELYQILQRLNASRVCAEFLIAMPLEFYSVAAAKSWQISWNPQDCLTAPNGVTSHKFAVVYRGGLRVMSENTFPRFHAVASDSRFVILEPRP